MTLISIGDLISHGFQDVMKTWKPTLKYTVWLFISPILLFLFAMLGFANVTPSPIIFILIAIGYIVMIVTLIWASVGVMQYMLGHAHGHATTTPKHSPLSYVPSLLWIFVLSTIPMILSWLVVILPSLVLRNDVAVGLLTAIFILAVLVFNIWFGISISQSSLLVLDEKARGIASLKESYAMILNRWWKTLWSLLLPNLLFQMCVSTAIMLLYGVAFMAGFALFGGWAAAIGIGGEDSMAASTVGFGMVGILVAIVFAIALLAFTIAATVAQMLFQASVCARLYLSLKQTK